VDPAGWQSLAVASEGYAIAEMRSVAVEVNWYRQAEKYAATQWYKVRA